METDEVQNLVKEYENSEFWKYTGIRVTDIHSTSITLALRPFPHGRNANGSVHGGVIAALLDSSMGFAARTICGGSLIVTQSLSMQFLKAAQLDETLFCTGKSLHVGRKILSMRGEVVNAEEELIAFAIGTFVVRR